MYSAKLDYRVAIKHTTNTSMLGLQLKRAARTGTTGLRRLATRQLSTAFADDEGPVGVMSETHEMLR
jgi:hypothetical protein